MNQRITELRARREAHERGFTLIELLVVIIILGILAAVVVFAVRGVGDKGDSAASSIDARTLRTAQEAYCAAKGGYGTEAELVQERFLSEGSSIHDVVVQPTGGTCNGQRFLITCDPNEATCGQNGTTPDGEFLGAEGASAAGMWTRTGDLPASTTGATMATMPNGKVLLFGRSLTGNPTVCRENGAPECPTSGTRGPWEQGPVAVYDPGTGAWSAAPPLPAPNPTYPDWNPITSIGDMLVLEGTTAECGLHCGKVFVEAFVGSSAAARRVLPAFPNARFYLFDPVAFDAGSAPWTQLADSISVDPSTQLVDGGFVIGHSPRLALLKNCSRTLTSDCGKVMVLHSDSDSSGALTPAPAPSALRKGLPGGSSAPDGPSVVALWDPLAPNTSAAWSQAPPSSRGIRTAAHSAGSTTLQSATANFTPADVGALVAGSGLSNPHTRITSFVSSTEVTVSDPFTTTTTGCPTGSTSSCTLSFGVKTSPGSTHSLPDGRLVARAPGGTTGARSIIYNPVSPAWTEVAKHPFELVTTCGVHGGAAFGRSTAWLPNGNPMAVASGFVSSCEPTNTSIEFNPATNEWQELAGPGYNTPCGSASRVSAKEPPGGVYGTATAMTVNGACSGFFNGSVWSVVPSTFAGTDLIVLADGRFLSAGVGGETWIFTPPIP